MKLVMDLVVNHTSDEHPWFVESRSIARQPEAGLVHLARRSGRRAPSRTTGARSSPARRGSGTRPPAVLPAPVRPQATGPELGAPSRYERPCRTIMLWWLDRGVDGFRMDVINFISKAAGLPDATGVPGAAVPHRLRRIRRRTSCARLPRRDDPRGLRRPRRRFITVGEMPGVTPEQAGSTPIRHGGELNMVFQFEHVLVDQDPANNSTTAVSIWSS